jgi:hypothetical protein
MNHIIAVHTYGSNRVKSRFTGQTVSAYKQGYTSASSAVLLALYGNKARDVSSKHASYHYIQIDAETTVRHGYLLLKVTDAELAKTEAITRQVHRPAVYRWQNDGWLEFPNLTHNDYTPIIGRSGPTFNPTGMRIVVASTGEAEPAIDGITVEVSQRSETDKPWHWIHGDTYPHRELLKRWGCRWSKKRKAWYYIGATLPESVQALIDAHTSIEPDVIDIQLTVDDDDPCSIEEAEAILGVKISPKVEIQPEPPPDDEPEEIPKIRIIKPVLELSDGDEPDAVISAIRQTKATSIPMLQPSISTNQRIIYRIPQSACGELTGSITGSVWCYGWAIYDGICVYLNMGGPRMAVEAIRAKLSRGEIANCVPWDAPAIELTAGEGNTGMYSAYMQNIPEAKFTSLILCHDQLTQPNYNGDSTTFIFHISDEQAMVQLRHHITQLVKVPVFPEWTSYLWHAGQTAMLLRPTRTGGDVKLYTVVLDCDAWTRLITGGLAEGIIRLPQLYDEDLAIQLQSLSET